MKQFIEQLRNQDSLQRGLRPSISTLILSAFIFLSETRTRFKEDCDVSIHNLTPDRSLSPKPGLASKRIATRRYPLPPALRGRLRNQDSLQRGLRLVEVLPHQTFREWLRNQDSLQRGLRRWHSWSDGEECPLRNQDSLQRGLRHFLLFPFAPSFLSSETRTRFKEDCDLLSYSCNSASFAVSETRTRFKEDCDFFDLLYYLL